MARGSEGPSVGVAHGVCMTMVSGDRERLRLGGTEGALDGTREEGGGTEYSRGGGVRAGVREGDGTGVGMRGGADGCPYPSGRGPSGTPGDVQLVGNPSLRSTV